MKRIMTLLGLLLLSGCAQPLATPDWIAGNPGNYPGSHYLLGRGQGANIGIARDRARADLAKVFAVRIREQSSDQLLWQQGGERFQGLQATVSREIQARTDQLIEGVRIAESWQSEAGGDYHALAVLERLQAGNRLRARINQLDDETTENIARARDEDTLPEQVAAARVALLAQLQRQHEQQILTVVDVTGSGIPARYQVAELKNDFERLLDSWQIAPQVTQDDLGGLQELLAGALGNAGVLHRASVAAADFQLLGELDSEGYQAEGWYWQRGVLSVSLQDPESGRVFGSHQWTLKVSSRQEKMLPLRVRSRLAEVLERELLEVLTRFGNYEETVR